MGSIDMNSGQRFERRIGRRVDVQPVYVTFFVPESGRFRKKVASHEVPGHIENVSVTGAAILGPPTVPWAPGDRVVVRSQGADNLVVVRHRHDTPNGTRFGVELTRSATTLKRQIQQLLEPHLTAPKPPAEPAGPVLGLRKAPVGASPVLPRLPQLRADAPPAADPPAAVEAATSTTDDTAPPAPLHGPGPVIDLSGPEPVIDLTDAVMGLEPDRSSTGDGAEAAASEPGPGPATTPTTEPEPAAAPTATESVEGTEATVEPTAPTGLEERDDEVTPEVTAATEDRAVAPRAPAPHLPHSHGRQVLDEVFGLMED